MKENCVIRLRCTCYLSAPTIEGREFCDINDRCAAIYAIKWPTKSVKNPDSECKETRQLSDDES